MIGYHFTTVEAYRRIREIGLQPSPLDPQPGLTPIQPYIRDGGIWLYRRRFAGHKLLGMLFYVAINHESDRIVRVAVEYDFWQAASWHALHDLEPDDTIQLTHDFTGVGHYGHIKEPFEVIITPVEPSKIRLMDTWNLMDVLHRARIRKNKAPFSPLPAPRQLSKPDRLALGAMA